jgi:hypothetical protein
MSQEAKPKTTVGVPTNWRKGRRQLGQFSKSFYPPLLDHKT